MRALLLAVLLSACATSARVEDPLAPLAFMQGCWIGSFDSPDGLQDERCYQRRDGQVRDRHTVLGTGYGGETTYVWNAQTQRIEVTYVATDGSRMTGVVRVEEDGQLWLRDGRHVGPDGAVQMLRSRWIPNPGGGFTVDTQREEGGVWRQFMRITYVRASAPAE